MRINSKLQKAFIYILIIALSISCIKEAPPVVITSEVSNVSATTAKSGGKILSEGTSTIQKRGVCWSTDPDPVINDDSTIDGEGAGNFNSIITNLPEATTFYLRAYAVNSSGTGYGKTVSFKTLGSAPTVLTQPVTNLTATTVTLHTMINSNYISTTVTFEYGLTTSYGSSVVSSNSPFTSNTNVRSSAEITDLLPNQTYHFRVKSENREGIVYSEDMTFKTLGGTPVVVSATVTSISNNTAILHGTINPNYLPTEVTFECGTSTSYELPALILQNPVTGSTDKAVFITITGLTANTTYHFRVKSVNSEGTVYGQDVTFKTMGGAPVIVAAANSSISAFTAILYGTVNPNYLPTEVTFEYGTSMSYELPPVVLQNPVTGSTGKSVFVTITGLSSNTTYHFRIKAVNSGGTAYSNDISFKTYASDFPIDGLVAYYTFAGGAALDLSGFENHAVITGPVSSHDRYSEANESFQFNSEDDLLLVRNPSFINNSSGSIAAWVKFDNLDYTQYVASVNDTSSNNKYIGLLRLDKISHKMGIYYRDPDPLKRDWLTGTTVLSANVYYHLVLTSDGGEYNLYINGVKETLQVVDGSNSGKWFSSLPGLDNFVIGNSFMKQPYDIPYMVGKIDELLVYNRKLSEAEVDGLYLNSLKK